MRMLGPGRVGRPWKLHYQATRAAKGHSNTPHRAQGTVADRLGTLWGRLGAV